MDLPVKQAKTIHWFAKNLESWRDGGWTFIATTQSLSLDMPCYQQDWDSRDLSPEEQDDLEDQIRNSGLRPFFEWGPLKMIVENLRSQSPDYSDSQLLQAIQYYWEHDAYIDISLSK